MIIAIVTALISAFKVQAAAPERWFEVELYIFKRDTSSTEQWPETFLPNKLRGNVDLITPIVRTEQEIHPAVVCSELDNAFALEADLSSSMMDDCVSQEAITQERLPVRIPFEISQIDAPLVYQGSPASLLTLSQSQFNGLITKIEAESGNQSLLHMTWQQAMLPKRKAKALHIFAGKDLSNEFQDDGYPIVTEEAITELDKILSKDSGSVSPSVNDNQDAGINAYTDNVTLANDNAPNSLDLKPQKTPIWQLNGKLNIYLNHYLYIEADLRLREPGIIRSHAQSTDSFPMGEDGFTPSAIKATPDHVASVQHFLYSIPLIQNRRVRSSEVHYFDHPKMGMFIQIRKMTQPVEKPIELTDDHTLQPNPDL